MPASVAIAAIIGGVLTPSIAAGALAFSLGGALVSGFLAGLSYLLAPKPSDLGAQRADTRHTVKSAVSPARWIVGRARVGGVLVFYHEVDGPSGAKDVHLALVLSEGACDAIERLWVNGEEVPFNRAARTAQDQSGYLIEPTEPQDDEAEDYRGKLWIYEYFAADGTQGDSLRAAASTDWTTNHKLTGLSWVHVHLRQPNYGNDVDKRVWTRLPELNFLLKGIKITWPGQATPIWTESAAGLRYWWHTVRRGIPDSAIDTASVRSAHSLCDQTISLTLPAGYEDYANVSKRYAVNGVIHADDDSERVEAELDFAWQGWAVETAGVYYFRPGSDRPVARTITPDDVVAIEAIQPAPALQDRINTASIALAQSREHDWLEASLPELRDDGATKRDADTLAEPSGPANTVAIATDGTVTFVGDTPDLTGLDTAHNLALFVDGAIVPVGVASGALVASPAPSTTIAATSDWRFARLVALPKDLRTRPFLADPIAGGRLLAIALRRARANATFTYRLKPGAAMEWLSVLPTDWVRITDTEHGLNDFQAMVVRSVVNEDWSVTLDLVEQPSGVYADTLVLPPLKPREISIPSARQVPAVSGLAVTHTASQQPDGTLVVTARITWDIIAVRATDLQWRQTGGTWTHYRVARPFLDISPVIPEVSYQYRARHLSYDGRSGDWTAIAATTPTGDLTPPALPTGLTLTAIPGGYRAQWDAPSATDYLATEIYESLPSVTDLAQAIALGQVSGTTWSRTGLSTATKLKVWIRHKDRSGNLGGSANQIVTSQPPASMAVNLVRQAIATVPGNWISRNPNPDEAVTLRNTTSDANGPPSGVSFVTRGRDTYENPFIEGDWSGVKLTVSGYVAKRTTHEIRSLALGVQETDSDGGNRRWPRVNVNVENAASNEWFHIDRQEITLSRTARRIRPFFQIFGSSSVPALDQYAQFADVFITDARLTRRQARSDFYAETTGTAWSDTLANNATQGDNIISDTVTLYNEAANYVETRTWNGSAWVAVDKRIDGTALFPGSVIAGALAAGSITADDLAAGVINAGELIAPGVIGDMFRGSLRTFNNGSATRTITVPSPLRNNYAVFMLAHRAGTSAGSVPTLKMTVGMYNESQTLLPGDLDFFLVKNQTSSSIRLTLTSNQDRSCEYFMLLLHG